MKTKLDIVAVGIGGYGNNCIGALREKGEAEGLVLKGCVEPRPEGCTHLSWLREQNIPVYGTLTEFYENHRADLAVISAPIHFHLPLFREAMEHGSAVLVEKPVCATVQDAFEMAAIRDRHGLLAAVGYQWSFSPAILALKQDILSGVLGEPLRCKTIILWPRDGNYYARSWAARVRSGQGEWILDSIVMNATAHYLHNPLFLAGGVVDRAAGPVSVTGELYRANDIENFDTACLRVVCESGFEIVYLASHAVEEKLDPTFRLEFEHAVVRYGPGEGSDTMTAEFHDGTQRDYGYPNHDINRKLFDVADDVRAGRTPVCGIETALPHLMCVNAIQEAARINDFSKSILRLDETGGVTYAEGLATALKECYKHGQLPSEAGCSFAVPAASASLRDYTRFKGMLI